MTIRIGDRLVGPGLPTWVVAEVSCNHAGRLWRAKKLVEAAALAGANAVKFQMYTPGELTCDSEHAGYRLASGPWAGQRLWDLYERARTPTAWLPELFELARSWSLEPFCSVFSPGGVRFAAGILDVNVLKVASAEVPHQRLISECAASNLPTILSDGMATTQQMAEALDQFDGGARAVFMHCVSSYPAEAGQYRLELIADTVGSGTTMPVGLSDHTTGPHTAVAAVALGASVVEKHLMLDRWQYWRPPLDAGHSVTPRQFAEMVKQVREVEAAMAQPALMGRDVRTGADWRRRLVFARALAGGSEVRRPHLAVRRCGMGAEPNNLPAIVGRQLAVSVEEGDPVTTELFK